MDKEIDKFYEIIKPDNFFKNWTDEEFIDWCRLGDRLELENLLFILEKEEMYELCILVKQVLKELI